MYDTLPERCMEPTGIFTECVTPPYEWLCALKPGHDGPHRKPQGIA